MDVGVRLFFSLQGTVHSLQSLDGPNVSKKKEQPDMLRRAVRFEQINTPVSLAYSASGGDKLGGSPSC